MGLNKLKKGDIVIFVSSGREETLVEVSNNRLSGDIVTNKNTYSTDFIYRWLEFEFIKIK